MRCLTTQLLAIVRSINAILEHGSSLIQELIGKVPGDLGLWIGIGVEKTVRLEIGGKRWSHVSNGYL